MAEGGRKRGRPIKQPEPGERVSLGFRVTPELKVKIEAAAASSGRSQSQEAEFRLEFSFADEAAFPNRELKFWAYLIAGAFDERGRFEAGMRGHPDWTAKEWMRDPLIYQSAMFEVVRTMILRQPKVDPEAVVLQFEALKGTLLTAMMKDNADG